MTKTERETMAEMQHEMDNLKNEVAGLKMDAMNDENTNCGLGNELNSVTGERDHLQNQLNEIDNELCASIATIEDVLDDLRSLHLSI